VIIYALGCGGVLNQSSGELSMGNDGDEGELHCNWTLGNAGVKQAVAIITLQRIYMSYCRYQNRTNYI